MTSLNFCLEVQEMGLHFHVTGVDAYTPTSATSCVTCVSSVVLGHDLLVAGAIRNLNTDIICVTISAHTCTFSCRSIPYSGAW